MRGVRKPLIAAVEGMACDLIFAAHGSRFGLPEVTIGLLPGAGGTQRLTNAVGKFRAMKMILLGAPIPAAEALDAGLVAALFDDGQVLDNVLAVAQRLASSSRIALSLAKESICRADDLGRDDDFERSLYYYSFGTRDKTEGVAAFLGKRSPEWPN
ncbi:hypothetical protein ACHAPB_005670 [Verticillium nonalfalfae]